MAKKELSGGRYLCLPIYKSEKKAELVVENEQGILFWFVVPVPDFSVSENRAKPLFYSSLNISGEKLTVSGDFPEEFFGLISVSNERAKAKNTHPAVHFAAENGWINDPNGLIFQDGLYHMYFQFNPCDIIWENMCWGHAVSSDLLHWRQLDDVLYPDEKGTIFSGSAIDNEMEMLGLPKNALLFYYTCAGSTSKWAEGKPFTQNIAYSTDGGKTLTKFRTAVPQITDGNRDPKIYYYPPKSLWYVVLYTEKNNFTVLNSTDMLNFKETQTFYMSGSGECPDLRKIPSSDGSEQWLFIAADGNYMLGDFDGITFTPKTEMKNAYGTWRPYAAQTFNKPDDRVIWTAFLRTESKDCTYTNMMSLPREISAVKRGNEYELALKPVKEYFEQRRETHNLLYSFAQNRAVEIEILLGNSEIAKAYAGEIEIRYDRKSGKLYVSDSEAELEKNAECLHILIDKGVLEIFDESYIKPAYFEVDEKTEQGEIRVPDKEKYDKVTVYEIV